MKSDWNSIIGVVDHVWLYVNVFQDRIALEDLIDIVKNYYKLFYEFTYNNFSLLSISHHESENLIRKSVLRCCSILCIKYTQISVHKLFILDS